MKQVKLSFVIPCYRSEKTISAVLDEIKTTVAKKDNYTYEVITVNDSSPDQVLSVLKEESASDRYLKVLDLAKNFGKHAALMAGYAYAEGDIIISVDDDGQCPVNQLWKLLEPLEQGYDISIAQYSAKKQSTFKNFGSFVNAKMTQILLKKPKELQLSNFSAMKKFVCAEILKYQNPYPYIDGLFLRTTGRIANVPMEERERQAGSSGYTLIKSLNLWLNGFTAFSVLPLRFATVLGISFSVVGFLFGLWTIIRKIFNPDIMAGYSSLMAVVLFVSGILMMMLGLIGEYIGRIYISINNSPQYVIREAINVNNELPKGSGHDKKS